MVYFGRFRVSTGARLLWCNAEKGTTWQRISGPFGSFRLIPSGLIRSISGSEATIYLAMTKRDVKAAPVFRPIEHSSESGWYNDFYGPSSTL